MQDGELIAPFDLGSIVLGDSRGAHEARVQRQLGTRHERVWIRFAEVFDGSAQCMLRDRQATKIWPAPGIALGRVAVPPIPVIDRGERRDGIGVERKGYGPFDADSIAIAHRAHRHGLRSQALGIARRQPDPVSCHRRNNAD